MMLGLTLFRRKSYHQQAKGGGGQSLCNGINTDFFFLQPFLIENDLQLKFCSIRVSHQVKDSIVFPNKKTFSFKFK